MSCCRQVVASSGDPSCRAASFVAGGLLIVVGLRTD
jgi:hypothetical protein